MFHGQLIHDREQLTLPFLSAYLNNVARAHAAKSLEAASGR